jgi:hypothetical protein
MAAEAVGVYAQGTLTGEALEDAANEELRALASDTAELADLGLTAADIRDLRFAVKEEAGADPEVIRLAVEWFADAVAGGAAYEVTRYTVLQVWSAILRRVRKRKGLDAVGAEVPEAPKEEAPVPPQTR